MSVSTLPKNDIVSATAFPKSTVPATVRFPPTAALPLLCNTSANTFPPTPIPPATTNAPVVVEADTVEF